MFWRYYKINQYHKTMLWITQGLANFPRVNFRYLVAPKGPLPGEGIIPINFKKEHIEMLIEKGKEAAHEVVKEGKGVRFRHFQDYMKQSVVNPTTTKTFSMYLNEVVKHN
jgi:hypothetical protein